MKNLSSTAFIIVKLLLLAVLLMNIGLIIAQINNWVNGAGLRSISSDISPVGVAVAFPTTIASTWLFLAFMVGSILCRPKKIWLVFSGSILSLLASGIAWYFSLLYTRLAVVSTVALYMAATFTALSLSAALFTYFTIRQLASNNPFEINLASKIMARLVWVTLIVVLVFTGVWSQDETLDPEFNRFFMDNHKEVLDQENVAIGIAGLDAPVGSNFMDVGRTEFQAANKSNGSTSDKTHATPKTNGRITFVGRNGELDCWTGIPESNNENPDCASEERLKEILHANDELISRYWQLSQMPRLQNMRRNSHLFLNINQLIAAEIELKLRHGQIEEAYQEWRENYQFVTRMIGEETDWTGKVALMVADGFSLTSAASLFQAYKGIAMNHGDEFSKLLKPTGLAQWDLPGILRAEYFIFAPEILRDTTEFWFHPNFIRNRTLYSAQAMLRAVEVPPILVEEKTLAVWREFGSIKGWHMDYLRDPMNAILARGAISGAVKERVGSLIKKMHILDGKKRALTLAVSIKQRALKDDEIAPFLTRTGPELRNPFTGAPMGWDPRKRTIRFKVPKYEGSGFEVSL